MEVNEIKHIPIVMILSYLSYTDLKKREVPDFAVLALFIYSLFTCTSFKESILMAALVFILLLIPSILFEGSIGGGDIKLLTALAFFMGRDFSVLAFPMFILLVATLIYGLIKGKGLKYSVPLVPYVFVSYLFYFSLEVSWWNLHFSY
ncbi:peptidase A24A prepilin type IV [Thermoanaerobacter mathranii subsp. mathranii str. A3]|uniref:Peptidase A24A prepilin type IV n=1 Tax=Thermoanaerobacter mathranii subsp. mathranii (strain DSM 11426 / CCUG 53645 / CIP 108742 / A3) TaxID=583358 RepID=A0ABM5LMF6_THEM3|nr:peptidase A24A prepilin type IV [Thermoanaerobacter mathranii subsp. mathranii str. A3]